jgi:catechol-2,3-dioxygenase
MSSSAIHPAAQIGHVHLWVTDLDRAIGFYTEVLGLRVTQDMWNEPTPRGMVFLAAGYYHHHIGSRERKTPISNEARDSSTSPCSTRIGRSWREPCSGSSTPHRLAP